MTKGYYKSQYQHLGVKYRAALLKIGELQGEKANLEEQVRELVVRFESELAANGSFSLKITDLKSKNTSLAKQIDDMKIDLAVCQKRKDRLREENANLRQQRETLNRTIDNLLDTKEDQYEINNSLRTVNSRLAKQLTDALNTIAGLRSRISELSAEEGNLCYGCIYLRSPVWA